MWKWITSSRVNKVVAAAIAALLVLASISLAGAWHFRGKMQEAKKAEKVQQEKASKLEKEGEARDEAYRKAITATDAALKGATADVRTAVAGVKEARTVLARIEAGRREVWTPPAVDNGDLIARLERAIEALP